MTGQPDNVVELHPHQEPYISRQQMADLMNISLDRLDHLVKQGMPSQTWGLRRRVFRASVALAWARQHEHDAA